MNKKIRNYFGGKKLAFYTIEYICPSVPAALISNCLVGFEKDVMMSKPTPSCVSSADVLQSECRV